jgi:hypothetical protein
MIFFNIESVSVNGEGQELRLSNNKFILSVYTEFIFPRPKGM